MSRLTPDGPSAAGIHPARERRRVVLATIVGTTVEWYDFFIYASAAGLVFGQLFFEPAGASLGTLLAFGSVGVSFLFPSPRWCGSRRPGSFAPTIATALVQATGTTTSVTLYLAGMTVLGLGATLALRNRTGMPLGSDHEELQAVSPVYGLARA